MGAPESTHTMDPSAYVAQHLQNFSTPHSTPAVDVRLWNWSTLLCTIVLAAVVVCVVARRDRETMMQILPSGNIGRRLSVWWACFWRQTLASLPLYVLVALVLQFLIIKLLIARASPLTLPLLSTMSMAEPAVIYGLAVVITWIGCLPLTGYMVLKGFIAHALAIPERLTFKQAKLLGLTTLGWTGFGCVFIDVTTSPFQYPACSILDALMYTMWGMYVVLPRQAHRLLHLT